MIITITGVSGSGKSYISNYLTSLDSNITHLDIDKVGHSVLEIESVKEKLVDTFGLTLNDELKINRKELSSIVFNDKNKMNELTDITWPEMMKIIDEFIDKNSKGIALLDWALIPNTKYFKSSLMNILVTASLNTRLKRAMLRDKITKEKFMERESAALSYNEEIFDCVINNENDENVRKLVKKIYDESIVSRKF